MAEDKEILPPWYNTECETCGGSYYATRASARPRPELLECEGCSEFRRGQAAADAAAAELRARVTVLEKRLAAIAARAEFEVRRYRRTISDIQSGEERAPERIAYCAVEDFEVLARMARGEGE